jgi:aspartyl-tRNA synthetase
MSETKRLKRQHYCGQVNEDDIDRHITVYGWVNKKRELGGLTFLDLRDREGILQVVVNEQFLEPEQVKGIGREYVLRVSGKVVRRSNPNPDLYTGQVELLATEIDILAESEVPPFFPEERQEISEELRFKYRYLDLRSQRHQRNFKIHSDVNLKIRSYLQGCGFLDLETPMLTKATPEGARDYLVPSRIYKGRMFALPQSPQIFKQLLMVSGFERYYQIVKCFRDEDLRADRQPEFTQVDIEMSFGDSDELFEIVEGLMQEIYGVRGITIARPFKRMGYDEAMQAYGSDKPDLRIPFKIADFTRQSSQFGSQLLNTIIENKGEVKGLVLPEAVKYSRKILDQINDYIREIGGKGAIWIKRSEGTFRSSLKIDAACLETFYRENDIDFDHIVFLIGDKPEQALFLAGKLREYLGREYRDPARLEFVWITDFPLFFYNDEEARLDSNHHPFTSPRPEDIDKLDSAPLAVRSVAYDLVLNGVEIGGGSRRINDIGLQKKIFRLLNLEDDEIEEKFGFFVNALKLGAPPHLGIALGLDRIVMLLCGEESIREVITFPKTTSSLCLLTGSPSPVPDRQLTELGIKKIQ